MIKIQKKNCIFLKSVFSEFDFPLEALNEIGFWGRSNVGKSSLLNALTKSNIAKTSKTPGRTRSLNFFQIENKIRLVDFPGYGFSKAPKKVIKGWEKLILYYLQHRRSLNCIFLLVDSRIGISKPDYNAIDVLESFGNHFFIVLTKIDKITPDELKKCIKEIENYLSIKIAADKKIFFTSCKNKSGIFELKKKLYSMMGKN